MIHSLDTLALWVGRAALVLWAVGFVVLVVQDAAMMRRERRHERNRLRVLR